MDYYYTPSGKKKIIPFNGSLEEFYQHSLAGQMDRETFEKAVIASTYHKDPLPIDTSLTDIRNLFDNVKLFNNHK